MWARTGLGRTTSSIPRALCCLNKDSDCPSFSKRPAAIFSRRSKLNRSSELGVPYRKIVEKAEAERADLIVMSTHGRTGIDYMLVGSVTQKVVARASCPVLSIRPADSR